MPERISKTQRWLDLVAFLVGRRLPVPVEEIMEHVPAYARKWVDGSDTERATARRTFERDKDELRRAGIPIETVPYTVNYGAEQLEGYVLRRRDFYLPYLRLLRRETGAADGAGEIARAAPSISSVSDEVAKPYPLPEVELMPEEATAALDALRDVARLPAFPFAREARSALRKLAFDLDVGALASSPVLFVDRPGAGEVRRRLRPLSEALLARKTVRFRYHGVRRGTPTDREVRPYGLFFQRGSWYLVGHDDGRDATRVFRVGRMEEVERNTKSPNTPDYEIPADFRLAEHLSREAWELGDEPPIRALVRFRFPLSLWAERNGHGEAVEEGADGSVVRAFDVQQVDPFLRWLLSLEGEAEVVSPPELAAELRRMAAEVAALYAGGDE